MQSPVEKRIDGFTLIELLLVIVLISIFATVAVWRQPQTDSSVQASAGVLKAHIRYCQIRAMNTNSGWGINFSSGNYALVRTDDLTTYHLLPGETANVVNLGAKGITISPAGFLLTFDGWGVPNISTEGSATIRLSKGETNRDITIIAHTGLVQ